MSNRPTEDQVRTMRTRSASELKYLLELDGFPQSQGLPPALLDVALRAAVCKQLSLRGDRLVAWARHNDGAVRALVCRLAAYGAPRDRGHLRAVLETLFANDVRPEVRRAAAVALGRFGQLQVKEALLGYLAQDPDAEVIDALGEIADHADDIIVRLKRAAQLHPEFKDQILGILKGLDSPRAEAAYRDLTGESRPD